jgi:hypothetical protein
MTQQKRPRVMGGNMSADIKIDKSNGKHLTIDLDPKEWLLICITILTGMYIYFN